MRIGLVETETRAQLVVERDGLRPLGFEGDLKALAVSGTDIRSLEVGERMAGRLAAPVRPGKIVAVGMNYRDHIREAGALTPESPIVFAKFPSCVTGPFDPIVLPAVAQRVDWEGELAVVISREMRSVDVGEALDYVFGYTVANDVSARDVQFSDGQWVRGKSFDTFCPLGPVIVTADEVPDPQALRLITRINGEVVQDSSTAEMLFGVAELLAFCSQSFTLDAGDILLTGTPWGCGEFMDPPRALAVGDLVETEIVGIGALKNPVLAEGGGRPIRELRHG